MAVTLNYLLNHLGRGAEADEDRVPAGPEPALGLHPPADGRFTRQAAWSAFAPRQTPVPRAAPYGDRHAEPNAAHHAHPHPTPRPAPPADAGFGAPSAPRGYLSVDPDAVRAALGDAPDPRQDGPPPPPSW
ncbi:hypothetical protein ACWEP8_28475 [Streptomyces hydrogenans]